MSLVGVPRTNIDFDNEACRAVLDREHLPTRAAVNFALRTLAEPLGLDAARRLRGSGFEGDLAQIRVTRVADFDVVARHTTLVVEQLR